MTILKCLYISKTHLTRTTQGALEVSVFSTDSTVAPYDGGFYISASDPGSYLDEGSYEAHGADLLEVMKYAIENDCDVIRFDADGEVNPNLPVYDLLKMAEEGDSHDQWHLGNSYSRGEDGEQNDEQAVFWYRKAAEQGHSEAQRFLGHRYSAGIGVPRDDKQALYWIRKAADQGNTSAHIDLGRIYETGEGVTQDYVEAVKWFQLAADRGYFEAQECLGAMYRDGKGVEKNDEQAIYWFSKAAEQNDVRAKCQLELMNGKLTAQSRRLQ